VGVPSTRIPAGAAAEAHASVRADLVTGWRALREHPDALPVIGAELVSSTVYGALTVLFVLLGQRLGLGAAGYGGVHVHDTVAALAFAVAGPSRTALITDAMVAAGMPDGDFELGAMSVTVRDGIARLAGGGSIAGSTLTMDVALRRAVDVLGVPIVDAARAAATTPARVLGLSTGALEPGLSADFVVLDDELAVRSVMVRGAWSRPAYALAGCARLVATCARPRP
jgi:hypothetical protein